jgi:hypothetical protein
MSWMIRIVQAGVSILLSRMVGNIVPILVMTGLAILSLRMRRPNWGLFIFTMVMLSLILLSR